MIRVLLSALLGSRANYFVCWCALGLLDLEWRNPVLLEFFLFVGQFLHSGFAFLEDPFVDRSKNPEENLGLQIVGHACIPPLGGCVTPCLWRRDYGIH